MKNLMWYTRGLNDYLGESGFVHYSEGGSVNFDFKEGRAFFFDDKEKTFGLVDIIPTGKLERANELTAEFRCSRLIELVESSKSVSEG